MREILVLALRPTIKSIASIISAALIKPELAGKYKIDYLLILENFWNCHVNSSPIHAALTNMVQAALEDSNEKKGIKPCVFICEETIENLTRPEVDKRCFSYDNFKTGTIQQVSSETYGLRLGYYDDVLAFNGGMVDILYQSNDDANCLISTKAGDAVIFVQRGQPIPKEGIQKMFYIVHNEEYDMEDDESSDGGAVVPGKKFSGRTRIIIRILV